MRTELSTKNSSNPRDRDRNGNVKEEHKLVHVDHVYYNVDFETIGVDKGPMFYSVQLSESVLPIAQDYHLAIIRFSLPTSDIPFVYFRIQQGLGQTDPDLGIYRMTLSYNGTDYTNPVMYRSLQIPAIPVPPPPSSNGGKQVDSVYYNIYFVDNFLYMINQALIACRDDLLTANPGLAPLEAPYYIYDSVNKFVNLVVPLKYSVEGIDLFYNAALAPYLFGQTAQYYLEPNKIYRVLLDPAPQYDNAYFPPGTVATVPPTWLLLKPDFSQIPYWGEMKGIVITSHFLPVRNEFSASQSNGDTIGIPILTDFNVHDWDGTASNIVFENIGVYRFIDLLSSQSVSQIDIQVYWRDIHDVLRPMTLYNGDRTANIKLVFVKDNLVS